MVCNDCISIIECVDKWNILTILKQRKTLYLVEDSKTRKNIQFSCLQTFYIVLGIISIIFLLPAWNYVNC